MFIDRIKKLGTDDYKITIDQEKELRFIFDALLYAKLLLSEHNREDIMENKEKK